MYTTNNLSAFSAYQKLYSVRNLITKRVGKQDDEQDQLANMREEWGARTSHTKEQGGLPSLQMLGCALFSGAAGDDWDSDLDKAAAQQRDQANNQN